jgi:hypothetical protein
MTGEMMATIATGLAVLTAAALDFGERRANARRRARPISIAWERVRADARASSADSKTASADAP